ncbi:MAG: hypothetical protein ACYDBJ_18065 [Aggregatilineales bacterium]
MLIMLDQVTKKTLGQNGRPKETITRNTLTPSHQGNGREYIVARLERDGYTDIAQQVLNREMTAAAARRKLPIART